MSIIYQALKKAQGERYRAPAMEYSFRSERTAFRQALLPAILLLPLILAFIFLSSQKSALTARGPSIKTMPNETRERQSAAAHDGLEAKALEGYGSARFEEAEALFMELAEESRSATAYSNLALASMRLGKKSEAEAAFKKALEMDEAHPQALNNYACLLAEAGKWKEALTMLEKAAAADPSYADARFNLAVLLEKNGDPEGAVTAYEDSLRLDPSSGTAGLKQKLMALRSEVIVKKAGGR